VAHGVEDGVLGDGVEDDPLDRLVLEDLLVPQHLQHMPGDGFALAVRVGRQDDLVGALHGAGDVGQALGRLAVDFPFHGEVRVGLDRAVLGGQIADVAERGVHLIAAAKVLVDRLCLCGRLDDDDVHAKRSLPGPAAAQANKTGPNGRRSRGNMGERVGAVKSGRSGSQPAGSVSCAIYG